MLLGEARSKCEHLAQAPLKPAVAEELHRMLLAKGVHATTAIEGNTLTEEQVRGIVEDNQQVPPSQQYLRVEVENVLNAIGETFNEAMSNTRVELSLEDIAKMNRLVLQGLELPDKVVPGEVRTFDISVGTYFGPPPNECQEMLARMCEWLNEVDFTPEGEHRIPFGILRAIMAHLYIAWIHPFGDGNGRTARCLEFKILVGCGVPSPAAHLLSNHYNKTRAEYYRQLEYASRSGGDVTRFVLYAVRGFVDGMRSQLEGVWNQLYDIAWRDYVHEVFQNLDGPSASRQRKLVLALSILNEPVQPKAIRGKIPSTMSLYAGKSDLTLQRDLTRAIELKLLVRMPEGYVANTSMIRGFAPGMHPGSKR